ncbi:GntR family transcriptional regulator [Modicisalibacter muralis]|uniref:GntR family transcriptional regulator n=2 Tax=Modicisalibacter muralis TaxID=119000 RepID=A0A1G9QDW0_9GAMM|nr:GntR family transcriptional regulator [Halomonas muralis]
MTPARYNARQMHASERIDIKENQPMSAPKGPMFQPLYRQIKDLLLERIADGEWPPGTFIPSESALAASYNVSVGTLRKALDELVVDNVVIRRQGKGTAVATHDADRALFRFFNIEHHNGERVLPVSRALSRARRRATQAESQDLALAKGAEVIHIRRVRELEGKPILLEDIMLDAERFAALANQPEMLPNTLYQLYQKQYGATVAHADERLIAIAAGAEEVAQLGVEAGEPLIEIHRIARDYQGTPIERRISVLSTREYCYTNTV